MTSNMMLSGKGASAFWRSGRRIVRGVERSSLALERVAVDALGQVLETRVRDAARSEVLPPSVNRLDDTNDLGSRLRRRIAKELALRHGVGKRRISLGGTDNELLVALTRVRGQDVVGGCQPIPALPRRRDYLKRVVLLVVVGVVDEDVEHHAAEELLHVAQVHVLVRHPSAAQ